MIDLDRHFPRYERFDPEIPVWCVTPGEGRCLHRFFDTSPFSPSGRYIAVSRLPFEDRLPLPGHTAEIVLIDLLRGEEQVVYETNGFETQLGANINWGGDDSVLLFNEVDPGTSACRIVHLNPFTRQSTTLPGGVYHVSPDGRYAAAADLTAIRRTQLGYGVLIDDAKVPRHEGAPQDDGLWVTDTVTGKSNLLISFGEAARYIPDMNDDHLNDWEFYGFHVKWNASGDRLLFVVRRLLSQHGGGFGALGHVRADVLTLRPDGTDVHNAVPAEQWAKGGHHMNFFPDGEHISMNLNLHQKGMLFCRVRYDGTDLKSIRDDVVGSGHPTIHPDGRHILTDAYANEKPAFDDDTVPIRWIDRMTGQERTLVRIGARTEPRTDPALRVDPHPAWNRDWSWIAFNGVAEDNTRRVFIANMSDLIG